MRDWTFLNYGTTCQNIDMALTIVQSDQTTVGQKLAAGTYVAVEGAAHAAVVIGSVACLSNPAVCVAGAKTALGIGGAAGQAACADGDCGNEVKLVEAAVQKGIQAIQNGSGTGYQSFEAFKRAQGGAGNGWAWHHIVPKLPGNVAKFGEQMINNTNNLIRLPEGAGSLHRQLTGIYNSINPAITGSRTMLVRDWVATLSYQEQWKFGIELIQKLGGAQYIIDKFK